MQEEFITHGYVTISNLGGYEIMLSNCGSAARVKDCFSIDVNNVSDWLEIESVFNEDTEEYDLVIDPNGYNINLNNVMRV